MLSALYSYIWSTLQRWGLANKTARILFLGLDNAGKSTLMAMLKTERLQQLKPSSMPTHEEIVVGNITFDAFDLGGHKIARRVWRDYFPRVDAIVFIVDAHDPDRFAEASEELSSLLTCEELKEVPFLVLGNKVDLGHAVSEDALRIGLGLLHTTTGKETTKTTRPGASRPMEVFMCSVVKRFGYGEGFRWLSNYL